MENTLTHPPAERPAEISEILGGLDRFNAEKIPILQSYVKQQCEEGFYDIESNLALLKLYQFNPQTNEEEIILSILSKGLVRFYASDFTLALHLLPCYVLGDVSTSIAKTTAAAAATNENNNTSTSDNTLSIAAAISSSMVSSLTNINNGNKANADGNINEDDEEEATEGLPIGTDSLSESVQRLCTLYNLLDASKYSEFWSTYESDDDYADVVCNVVDFEDALRLSIAKTVELSCRRIPGKILKEWVNLSGNKFNDFVLKTLKWSFEEGTSDDTLTVLIPSNKDNEAKTVVTNETVYFEQLARIIKRGYEIK